MFSQNAAEEQEKGQAVDDAARTHMPSALAEQKGKDAASYPDEEKNVGCDAFVKIKQTPGQEEQRKAVGCQMTETAMDQRVGKDAEHPPFLHWIDSQAGEIPSHADL